MMFGALVVYALSATSLVNIFLLLICPILVWDLLHMKTPPDVRTDEGMATVRDGE